MRIHEEAILKRMAQSRYKPLTFEELLRVFCVPKEEKRRFRKMIRRMRKALKIVLTADRCFRLVDDKDFVVGAVKKNPEGFGFLIPDNPTEGDIYLSRYQLMRVMNKDRLKVLKRSGDKRKTGKFQNTGQVIEILQRGSKQIVGKLLIRGKKAFVIPQKSGARFGAPNNVLIPYSLKLEAAKNQIVVCRVKKFPQMYQYAVGEVDKVLGALGKHEIDFSVMLHQFDLRHPFSKAVLKQANRLKANTLSEERQKRKDLTHLPFITIDGETAKDFDDAVFAQKLSDGRYKLWVAIADVSFFVQPDSVIDREAYARATSVYFPGGVVPMLPEALSNDLCSLTPQTEKMTFCCEMTFDPRGKRLDASLYESVMVSRQRMTYTDVQAILDGDKAVTQEYAGLVKDILAMDELKNRLRGERRARGCLDFDLPEPELLLDLQGKIESIVKHPRLEAHMLIEEFMIAANEAVAEFMYGRKCPFIYRVHDEPDPDKLFQLNTLAHNVGYPVRHQKKIHPKVYAELLERVKGKPPEKLIHNALLRTMKLAVYSASNLGHFGLASGCYTHFTSPIRRYPDLIAHRLLKRQLKRNSHSADTIDDKMARTLEIQADHCSKLERNAEQAEREFVALKKAQFMLDKVGQSFDAFISGMAEFGFFVELEKYFVEGLVPLRSLADDYYEFISSHYLIRGRRHKNTFRLGQKIKVRLTNVDLDKRQIDFVYLG